MWVAGSHQSKLGELPAHTPLAADIADELARTETVSDATARHQTALEKQSHRIAPKVVSRPIWCPHGFTRRGLSCSPDISIAEVLRQQFSNTTPKAAAQAIRQLKSTCLDLLQLRMGQCDHDWNSSHQGVLRPNPQ